MPCWMCGLFRSVAVGKDKEEEKKEMGFLC
jgi:hypothetical protein